MSIELETLDQLLGGDMPLAVIRTLYPDEARLIRGILGLLSSGDVSLLRDSEPLPKWQWREAIAGDDRWQLRLRITDQGIRRIA